MRHTATQKGAEAVFLFIAELNGFKQGTVTDKLAQGKQCYLTGTLHELDYSQEDDRADVHENIWLNRLYDQLDEYYQLSPMTKRMFKEVAAKKIKTTIFDNPNPEFKWSVPIELDASALT